MLVEVHLPREIHLLSVRFHVKFYVTFVVNKPRKVRTCVFSHVLHLAARDSLGF